MSQKINKIDAGKFLRDNGLLFEINKTILHPLGLALEVFVNSDNGFSLTWQENELEKSCYLGREALGNLWDYRDDPEGILFGKDTFVEGKKKYEEFMQKFGNKKLKERKDALGFIVQEDESQ